MGIFKIIILLSLQKDMTMGFRVDTLLTNILWTYPFLPFHTQPFPLKKLLNYLHYSIHDGGKLLPKRFQIILRNTLFRIKTINSEFEEIKLRYMAYFILTSFFKQNTCNYCWSTVRIYKIYEHIEDPARSLEWDFLHRECDHNWISQTCMIN